MYMNDQVFVVFVHMCYEEDITILIENALLCALLSDDNCSFFIHYSKHSLYFCQRK